MKNVLFSLSDSVLSPGCYPRETAGPKPVIALFAPRWWLRVEENIGSSWGSGVLLVLSCTTFFQSGLFLSWRTWHKHRMCILLIDSWSIRFLTIFEMATAYSSVCLAPCCLSKRIRMIKKKTRTWWKDDICSTYSITKLRKTIVLFILIQVASPIDGKYGTNMTKYL